jgi:hypothetical protein
MFYSYLYWPDPTVNNPTVNPTVTVKEISNAGMKRMEGAV